jgi:hypothetical protein
LRFRGGAAAFLSGAPGFLPVVSKISGVISFALRFAAFASRLRVTFAVSVPSHMLLLSHLMISAGLILFFLAAESIRRTHKNGFNNPGADCDNRGILWITF